MTVVTDLPADMFDDIVSDIVRVEEVEAAEKPQIPAFEGQEVQATKVSFTSGTNLEIEDGVYRSEDIVRFVVEARVSAVNHKTNEKTGGLERIHTVKVIDVTEIPYDLDLSGATYQGR